jgi:hypothetical protein
VPIGPRPFSKTEMGRISSGFPHKKPRGKKK